MEPHGILRLAAVAFLAMVPALSRGADPCVDSTEEVRIERTGGWDDITMTAVATTSAPDGVLTYRWTAYSGRIDGPADGPTVRIIHKECESIIVDVAVDTVGDTCGAPTNAEFAIYAACALWLRCDTFGDGAVDISDAIGTLNFIFLGGPPSRCPDAGDCNGDGLVDVSDPIFDLAFLFLGGRAPPAPFPLCEPFPYCPGSGCWD
jgi:hypothetical protein